MTKNDYVLIARTVRAEVDMLRAGGIRFDPNKLAEAEVIARRLCDAFAAANGSFKRDTFMQACGF